MRTRIIALITAIIITISGLAGMGSATAAPPKNTFKDVSQSHLFYKEISWMKQNGFSTGWSDNTYRPNESIKRDAVIAFLYRMEGSPKVDLSWGSPFVDVSENHPFYKEIMWAFDNGITTGWVENGKRYFKPNAPIKRDAMAAFLYRINGAEEIYYYYNFKDVKDEMPFAWEMRWMQQKGIANGWSDGTYRPLQNTQRDAMAAFLYRAHHAGVFKN